MKMNDLREIFEVSAGAVAIFGPGTIISDSAIKMLELLIAARKQ